MGGISPVGQDLLEVHRTHRLVERVPVSRSRENGGNVVRVVGGSVPAAVKLVGTRPSTAERQVADWGGRWEGMQRR
jgi:hypothetical protein